MCIGHYCSFSVFPQFAPPVKMKSQCQKNSYSICPCISHTRVNYSCRLIFQTCSIIWTSLRCQHILNIEPMYNGNRNFQCHSVSHLIFQTYPRAASPRTWALWGSCHGWCLLLAHASLIFLAHIGSSGRKTYHIFGGCIQGCCQKNCFPVTY